MLKIHRFRNLTRYILHVFTADNQFDLISFESDMYAVVFHSKYRTEEKKTTHRQSQVSVVKLQTILLKAPSLVILKEPVFIKGQYEHDMNRSN
jgi:hypothetical protein